MNQTLTAFDEALLAAVRASPPRVRRAMVPYILLNRRPCRHGNRASHCPRCLITTNPA